MTPERLAEIRERAESVKTWKGYHAEPVPRLLDVDVPALLAEVERLRAELATVRELYETASAIAEQATALHSAAHAKVERVEAELAEAREQVKRTETAVHAYFADADERGVHLDGMTVDELCDAVMAAIRALDGPETAAPDLRTVALEQLAERYSEAFECLLYRIEQERGTQ
jgi:hypothetical protein